MRHGRGRRALGPDGQPGARDRRRGAARGGPRDAVGGRSAAVLGGGREPGGVRGAAPDAPLPRHPPPPAPACARDAQPRRLGHASGAGGRGLPRRRDARAHALDPRGRTRLPGAEPPAARLLVRPPAEPPAVQAAPDGRRDRALLPDRPLLPRRGSARRPPARVHAARRRGLLRRAAGRAGTDGAGAARVVRGGRSGGRDALPAHHAHGGDAALRHRPTRHALRDGDPRLDRPGRVVGLRRLRGSDRRRAAWCVAWWFREEARPSAARSATS